MDPNYAPAWEQLGVRCYYDADYSDGGEAMFQRSNEACERAVTLDPNRIVAASQLIANHVERGELGKAYREAEALVKRRPDSAQAHFAMSYVYRYAGMLEQAAGECDTAVALDPGNYAFRSCAWTFAELGKPERATDFVRLDAGSEWAAYAMPSILLREGKVAEAREAVKHMPATPRYHRDLLEACLLPRPADLERIAHEDETNWPSDPDPELWYYQGAILAYCGKKAAALHMLESAVEQNYCAYSGLLSDPLLAKLRTETAFDKVLTMASSCQGTVLSGRGGRRALTFGAGCGFLLTGASVQLIQSHVAQCHSSYGIFSRKFPPRSCHDFPKEICRVGGCYLCLCLRLPAVSARDARGKADALPRYP